MRLIPFIFLFIPIISGCDEVEPTLPAANLILLPTDTRVTGVVFSLHAEPNGRPWTILIERDGMAKWVIGPSSAPSIDTTLRDSLLTPVTPYAYRAFYLLNGDRVDSSTVLSMTTMDTSNHSFTWQLFTFGNLGSELRDVAIINDTCVWVIGRIARDNPDGSGGEVDYGAAVWNGSVWTDTPVPWRSFGSDSAIPGEVNAILAFGGSDIYIATLESLLHWDGIAWKEVVSFVNSIPFNHQISTIWGSDPGNIYCGGRNGAIYKVNDSTWDLLPSSTTYTIQDIWGDGSSGPLEILAIASNPVQEIGKDVLSISHNAVSLVDNSGIDASIASVWFVSQRAYFISGRRIFENRSVNSETPWVVNPGTQLTPRYKGHIRGRNVNDILVGCDYGAILHYDGRNWRNFSSDTYLDNGLYRRVALSEHLAVAVGVNNGRGVVALGKR